MGRKGFAGAAMILLLAAAISWGQDLNGNSSNSYTRTDLVSDVPGRAKFTDSNLVNAWGIALGSVFWVSDNGTGLSTLYALDGTPQSLVVTIPPSASNSGGVSAPTGQVINSSSGFVVNKGGLSGAAIFIFASEDGAISGWSPGVDSTHGILAVDHGANGAVYKGMALSSAADRLYVTNFHVGKVEIYDQSFTEIDTGATFVDPTIPTGYAPFGIQNINGSIYVSYAKQDAAKHDDDAGAGHGYVSVFDASGAFIKRLITRAPLNSPWGLALAPANFGKASGRLLVGNFGNGRTNIFDLDTGEFIKPLEKSNGNILVIDGLWGLSFSGNDLYITAGVEDEAHGLFAEITADNP
jgi:uncharacterized protein (TIGR03118 family)